MAKRDAYAEHLIGDKDFEVIHTRVAGDIDGIEPCLLLYPKSDLFTMGDKVKVIIVKE